MTHISIQQKIEVTGAWSAIFLCFSIACLGTSLSTISLIIAIVLWLVSSKYSEYTATIKKQPFTIFSLFLLFYLGVSIIWSSHPSSGFTILNKYREFLLFPIFLTYFSHDKYRQHGIIALYTGMLITLLISYFIFFGIISNPPRQHSIGNHIFNGILIAFFAYCSLFLAFEYKKYKYLFLSLFILSFFCIFVIRQGQTGQIILILLSLLFIYQKWKRKALLLSLLLLIPLSYYLLSVLSNFSTSTFRALTSLDLNTIAQLDIRLEYYINTCRVIFNHWLLGVGAGGFPSAYISTSSAHQNFWGPTQNAHNEFLMITSQTGIIGLFLFTSIFICLYKKAVMLSPKRSNLAIATLLTITISCLFNASFLDNNDGTLFLILISLFFSQPHDLLTNK